MAEITPEIIITLSILVVAVILFLTERIRVDLVALLVLGGLALTGTLTPAEVLSGFSNPAVVTVWAVFILSGGLSRTGVANIVGKQVLRWAGNGEVSLVLAIMVTSGLMSAFMNNVGVAALMLPVVMDIARRTDRPPSKLLIPLAFGCLLGGLTTQIGTPPNIIASDALQEFGLRPFQLFDYSPVGLIFLIVGVLFMVLIGRHLLPVRYLTREFRGTDQDALEEVYELQEKMYILKIPPDSALAGKTLMESKLGSILNLNVISIIRDGQTILVPDPVTTLMGEDRLCVIGSLDRLNEFGNHRQLVIEQENLAVEDLMSSEIKIAEVKLSPKSSYIGKTVDEIELRKRYGVNILAIMDNDTPYRTNLQEYQLSLGNTLLVHASQAQLEELRKSPQLRVTLTDSTEIYRLQERLLMIGVPAGSAMDGKTLEQSHLGDAFSLTVLGIVRDGEAQLMPEPSEVLRTGDTLFVEGKQEDVKMLRGFQSLEVESERTPDLSELESPDIGLLEVVLSPYTTLANKTLRRIHFREKFGLNVLAIWRKGQAFRTNLRDMALRHGDAFLLYGSRRRLRVLGREPDFLVLSEEVQDAPRMNKSLLATMLMGGVILTVLLGWLPISIAAVIGATLMIVSGCLKMEEAYRYIEWQAVFLIAGMLPLGIALQKSGAASFIADGVVTIAGDYGPLALLVGVFILTSLASQFMPNAVVTVLMAPIAVNAAQTQGISPYALMMVVALAASASFLSPVGHPANILVMGPGGYRFKDYVKVGLPLTIIALVVAMFALPVFWPLNP